MPHTWKQSNSQLRAGTQLPQGMAASSLKTQIPVSVQPGAIISPLSALSAVHECTPRCQVPQTTSKQGPAQTKPQPEHCGQLLSACGMHGTPHTCVLHTTALRKESKLLTPLLLMLGGYTDPHFLKGHMRGGLSADVHWY